jgi:hypothetical protein
MASAPTSVAPATPGTRRYATSPSYASDAIIQVHAQ